MADHVLIDRAVVEQALEVLENAEDQLAKPYSTDASNAITALRAALAQAETLQDLIPPDSLFVCDQMGAHVTRVRLAQQAEPVAHRVVAGALFDFMGWLTSRRERLVLSSTDDAAPAADAIKDFAEMRGLSMNDAQVKEWQDNITSPPRRKPLTEEAIYEMYNEPRSDAEMVEFARAIERAHGIKEAK